MDILRTRLLSDAVVLIHRNGDREYIDWCAALPPGPEVKAIHVPRMPVTLAEGKWFWFTLPKRLSPGASVRLVGST